jgi:hypothetical protein
LCDTVTRRGCDNSEHVERWSELTQTHAHAAVMPGDMPQLIEDADARADIGRHGGAT